MNELKHLAIIMDGNGRWAKNQAKARNKGHQEGAKTIRKITEFAAKNQIEFLTLYAFSTENWNRPKSEVEFLMKLLKKFLKNETQNLIENNIKFQTIGNLEVFSPALQKQIQTTKEATKNCNCLTQTLAINYGSKDEIIRAFKKLIQQDLSINEENLSSCLDTNFMPPVDLLIRTGGEIRLSNFLLWQAAYAELRFTDTLWPDFCEDDLSNIIKNYKNSNRRFGAI